MDEAYLRAGRMTTLEVVVSVSFCFPHAVVYSVFMMCCDLCVFVGYESLVCKFGVKCDS